MDYVYALGVSIIEITQYLFEDYEGYFEFINNVSNPNHTLEYLLPLMSIIDSVFASQLVLCMAFGGWANAVCKWWLFEDRPYWWVRETDFYTGSDRPVIVQTTQTCETGPGCPSGHSESAAMLLVLTIIWISHVMTDRKLNYVSWWKYVWYPLCAISLGSVMLARLFVGTHFPHQVLLGAILGAYLAPLVCIYVTDPFLWQCGPRCLSVKWSVFWHCVLAGAAVLISLLTYFSMILCGYDPQWTIKLAFRWCEQPENIHVSTTPMFALAHSTGYLLGWAISVTPTVTEYRHDTKSRSLIIAAFSSGAIFYLMRSLQHKISKDSAILYYIMLYSLCAIKVPLFLRLVPALATWPYGGKLSSDIGEKLNNPTLKCTPKCENLKKKFQ